VGFGATARSKGIELPPSQPAFPADGKFAHLLELLYQHPHVEDDGTEFPPPDLPPPDFDVPTPTIFEDLTDLTDVPPLPSDLFPLGGVELGESLGENFGDVAQGDLFSGYSNDGLYKVWQNGFGDHYEQEGRRWSSNIETRPRHVKFLMTWSGLGQAFRNLPVAMARCTSRPQHYWSIIYVSTKIQVEEFGFSSAPQFVKCRGWVLSRKHGKFVLEYQKVKEIIHACCCYNGIWL